MRHLAHLLLAAALTLVACGTSDDNNDPTTNNTASTTGSNNTSNQTTQNTSSGAETNTEKCAGDYLGGFMGDDTGVLTAALAADGVLTLTFTTSAGPLNATGTVTEAGAVSGAKDDTTVTGLMNFDDCTMAGDWETTGFGGGTWSATRE